MTLSDKRYLSIQFELRIKSCKGKEFQSFFERIMEKACPDFQKIRPYGNKGDGGNDGYDRKRGIYYQVYAPDDPRVKGAEAAKKFEEDFEKLKKEWSGIKEIKEYNFVFNDEYKGSNNLLEEKLSKLEERNLSVLFKLFLAKDLEKVFFKLDEKSMSSLGFNVDSRESTSIISKYLKKMRIDLDREDVNSTRHGLEKIGNIIPENSQNLILEYELLEGLCLKQSEKIEDAKIKYNKISREFPEDMRAFLMLARIYLDDSDFKKNEEFLEKAEKINKSCPSLGLVRLLRKYRLGEEVDLKNLDEKGFLVDSRIKAEFYRLCALFSKKSGDKTTAVSFVEKAIRSNSEMLKSYLTKLEILSTDQNDSQKLQNSQELLEEIKKVETQFSEYGEMRARNKAILNFLKLNGLIIQENFQEVEKVSKETFELSMNCYLDKHIDLIMTNALCFISLTETDLNKLLDYVKKSEKNVSEELSKILISKFIATDCLFTIGKSFFEEINCKKFVDFIQDLEAKNYNRIIELLKDDIQFSIIVFSLRDRPDLRKKIIENLPDGKVKTLYSAVFNYEQEDFDGAFKSLKQLDLSKLKYSECLMILPIIQKKEAWDNEIILLKKILEKERNEKMKSDFQLRLFNVFFMIKRHPEVRNLGKKLLKNSSVERFLSPQNKIGIIQGTVSSLYEMCCLDKQYLKEAKELIKEHQTEPSFESKYSETLIHLENDEPENAIKQLIEGVKIKKKLLPEEYANLFLLMSMITNKTGLDLTPSNRIRENTFVKVKDRARWYFIGESEELDAIPINKNDERYPFFTDKKIGDNVVFKDEYNSKNRSEIELIFPIEKYVLWQVSHNFKELANSGGLAGVKSVEIPKKKPTKYLFRSIKDSVKRGEAFFDMYCKNDVPLALLAINESSLSRAIGRIQAENRGFINFSESVKEFEEQKRVAKKIILEKMPFYIDGTSAFFLSCNGSTKKICSHSPNLKVPHSVINLLNEIINKDLRVMPKEKGRMGYAQGKMYFSNSNQYSKDKELLRDRFIESVKSLDKTDNIEFISLANKENSELEQKILPELSDACILARKENVPVMTEDFLYLKWNEVETKKKAPEYFSSLALLRVLYEEGKVSFEDYLDHFSYLSCYRFRFLSINLSDLEKSVFSDKKDQKINPQNIRKLNFPLTLSEEYGASFGSAQSVVLGFLLIVLMNNKVNKDVLKEIFFEIIESFPQKTNKKEFGKKLLLEIEKNLRAEIISGRIDKLWLALK